MRRCVQENGARVTTIMHAVFVLHLDRIRFELRTYFRELHMFRAGFHRMFRGLVFRNR